jgi:filamentous hemagglutinin
MPPAEKLAYKQEILRSAATINGWVEDKALTKLNGRVVYRDANDSKVLWAQDTQHGAFEKTNSKGVHQGEFKINGESVPNSIDRSGGHDLKVK